MNTAYFNIPLVKNKATNRFEIALNNSIAFIDYKETANQIALVHTEVPKAISGRGVASALVEKTLQHIKKSGKKILPYCSYVFAYIQKHNEWAASVAIDFKDTNKS